MKWRRGAEDRERSGLYAMRCIVITFMPPLALLWLWVVHLYFVSYVPVAVTYESSSVFSSRDRRGGESRGVEFIFRDAEQRRYSVKWLREWPDDMAKRTALYVREDDPRNEDPIGALLGDPRKAVITWVATLVLPLLIVLLYQLQASWLGAFMRWRTAVRPAP